MKQVLLVPELRELLAAGDFETIRRFCQDSHPATVAELISGLEAEEIWQILHLLSVKDRAEVFPHFDLDQQVELASGENRRGMARLLEEMEPDERADLVQRLDEKLREDLLPLMARAEREDIRKLVSYAEGTAGSVMTTDYAVIKPGLSVSQALEQVRIQAPGKETIYYIYVVDDQHRLLGLVSLRDLIMSRPSQTVEEITESELVSLDVNADQEEVARTIEKFDLIALPIVNGNNVLVGIVTHDDAMDILRQEQQEDVEKLMAITGSHQAGEYLRTPAFRHFRNRVMWVLVLGLLGFVSGFIVESYKGMLLQFAILATFMPMLADTGGNTGSQAAALVIRALAVNEIKFGDIARILLKELRVAMMLAIVMATVAFVRVLLFGRLSDTSPEHSLAWIAMAISIALGLQVISATLLGATLPLLASKMKLDPALVASPALTTTVDITGLLIFFSTTNLLLF